MTIPRTALPETGFLLRVLCVHVHVPTAATMAPRRPRENRANRPEHVCTIGRNFGRENRVVVDPRIRFELCTDQKNKLNGQQPFRAGALSGKYAF